MKKILIIDDDKMMLNALTTLLESEDCVIETSTDGEGGIRLYREHRPNIVLLDLRLPTTTGIEVLKEIMHVDGKAKVIIITGYPTPEVRTEAIENGALFFYEKSKDITQLTEAVQKVLAVNAA